MILIKWYAKIQSNLSIDMKNLNLFEKLNLILLILKIFGIISKIYKVIMNQILKNYINF